MALHSYDSHCAVLAELCRVCGDKNLTYKDLKQRRKRPKACKELMSDLILVFGIDIKNDDVGTHPEYMCYKCVTTIGNVKRWQYTTTINKARELAINGNKIWTAFSEQSMEECTVCHHRNVLSFGKLKKGINLLPAKHISHPSADGTTPQNQQTTDEYQESNDESHDVLVNEVDVPLQPLVGPSKPVCHVKQITKDCATSPIEAFKDTPINQSSQEISTSPAFKDSSTLEQSLTKPLHIPLNKEEEAVTTHLFRRKLFSSKEKDMKMVRLKTGGQRIAVKQVIS